ncbi:MAG TPA: SAM-dependent methyltransferase [Actinomycetales bacterium]|nr:SAM-dependent methyltransferase [Actinomycetales bacterium]
MTSAAADQRFVPWDVAWHDALYGEHGFYRAAAASAHFRTSVHASPLLASALVGLARGCGLSRVVDVGSGRGELLSAMADAHPDLDLVGVDVVGRPAGVAPGVRWLRSPGGALLPDELDVHRSLVVAHEWLDDVPCPVAQVDDQRRWRAVHVDPATGEERLGPPVDRDHEAWLTTWWPAAEPRYRAEVGLPRDNAWARLVAAADGGVLLAVDYAHQREDRPPRGSLVGHRDGRVVPPVPDGSCDVTAHVAIDSVAQAGEAAGATQTVLTSQHAALRSLGVTAELPGSSSARTDPPGYLASLRRAGEAAELLDRGGLGSFTWLVQSRRSAAGPGSPRGAPGGTD